VVLQRLGSSETFRLVYRQGRRLTKDALILYVRPNGLSVSRAGVSVARGAGTAVRRNRLRRRVREALRLEQARVAGGFDLVLVSRAAASGVRFDTLRAAVRDLLAQAGAARAGGEESTGRVR
jgi:ribonuclease P protein component